MIRALISDCFGVIMLPLGKFFHETYIPNYHKRQQEFIQLGYQHSLGHISTDQYLAIMAKETGFSPEECRQRLRGQWVLNEPLVAFYQQLKAKYKLGLLSNVGGDLRTTLPIEVQQLFDVIVPSAEVGLMKPDPALFRLIADKLAVKPAEAVMIDDMPVNCAGAEAAGMQAIYYDAFESVKQKFNKLV